MRTWCPPNSNPSDDLTSDLDRESSPKYQHLIVHFAEGLQGRHLIDQLSKFRRWAPETRGRIGLFPATINRMGPGPIGSAHSAKDTGSVYNRHTYPVTVFVASIQLLLASHQTPGLYKASAAEPSRPSVETPGGQNASEDVDEDEPLGYLPVKEFWTGMRVRSPDRTVKGRILGESGDEECGRQLQTTRS